LTHPNKWRLSDRLAVAIALSILSTAALAATPETLAAADPCESLRRLTIANVTVAAVSEVPAGTFSPLHANEGAAPIDVPVPGFCRVEATAAPTPDSQICIEVWPPKAGSWNGKPLGVGNGGYSSILDYKAMADGISRGYVTVGTDGGHRGDDIRCKGDPSRSLLFVGQAAPRARSFRVFGGLDPASTCGKGTDPIGIRLALVPPSSRPCFP
jgi:feruloyl esterase